MKTTLIFLMLVLAFCIAPAQSVMIRGAVWDFEGKPTDSFNAQIKCIDDANETGIKLLTQASGTNPEWLTIDRESVIIGDNVTPCIVNVEIRIPPGTNNGNYTPALLLNAPPSGMIQKSIRVPFHVRVVNSTEAPPTPIPTTPFVPTVQPTPEPTHNSTATNTTDSPDMIPFVIAGALIGLGILAGIVIVGVMYFRHEDKMRRLSR